MHVPLDSAAGLELNLIQQDYCSLDYPMELKIASFNIRYDTQALNLVPIGTEPPRASAVFPRPNTSNAEWGERPWFERRAPLADQVLWENPSVIGFQEVSSITLSISYTLGRETLTFVAGTLESDRRPRGAVGRRLGLGRSMPQRWCTARRSRPHLLAKRCGQVEKRGTLLAKHHAGQTGERRLGRGKY